jgi:MFS family permease
MPVPPVAADPRRWRALWVVLIAALLITGGRLGDIFGRKRLYLVGVAGFTAASALCGLAASPAMLIGARVLQGTLACLLVPLLPARPQVPEWDERR